MGDSVSPLLQLRKPPPRGLLRRLAGELAPGGELIAVRRLKGGISCGMHALSVRAHDGEMRSYVLRRYTEYGHNNDPAVCEAEWKVLQALAGSHVAAPRPVWKDCGGNWFGGPSLVTTLLEGRGTLAGAGRKGWLRELARALAAVHRVKASNAEIQSLRPQSAAIQQLLSGECPMPVAGLEMDTSAVISAIRRLAPARQPEGPTLVHGDYWAGNTLWSGGRLTGVVDWEQALIGDPGEDVGYCRMDLAMMLGPGAADGFLGEYEKASGERVPDIVFWDLVACVRPLPDPGQWLPGYLDLGRRELSAELLRQRLAGFARASVERAGA